jgi:hypothetical protein
MGKLKMLGGSWDVYTNEKKSTKELNHFTNLQLSSMDHQVDPAEHFRKTTVSLPKLQTSQFHLIS